VYRIILLAVVAILTLGVVGIVTTNRDTADHDPTTQGSTALGPQLSVSDAEAEPGALLTVAGHGCVAEGNGAQVSALVWFSPAPGTVEWQPSFGDPVAELAPSADGSWSVDIRVPEWVAEYRLEAACFDDSEPPGGFVYARERVVVR